MFFNHTNILKLVNLYKLSKKKYSSKRNIQEFLKKRLNRSELIKISYDVQSGDYIKTFNKFSKKKIDNIYYPIVAAIKENFKNSKTILDFGCGELTTSHYIFNFLKHNISKYFANDNSLNRLVVGQNYLKKKLNKNDIKKFEIFCNSNYKLPFKDNSIDLIITIHSLEPNNEIKKKIIDEFLRISRHGMVLMEPHYEISSKTQKKRMNRYGYIKGLEKLFKSKDVNLKIIKKNYHNNKNNISSLFIIKKKYSKKKNSFEYVDPIDLTKLRIFKNYFYSKNNFRIFPIIDDVKVFNNDTQLFLPSIKE
jgi:SAM-dependent methyltransferase